MKKENLIIIGASALGRQSCAYAQDCCYNVAGFLDSRPDILKDYPGYPPILGDAATYRIKPEDRFCCAVGEPDAKREFVNLINSKSYTGGGILLRLYR